MFDIEEHIVRISLSLENLFWKMLLLGIAENAGD